MVETWARDDITILALPKIFSTILLRITDYGGKTGAKGCAGNVHYEIAKGLSSLLMLRGNPWTLCESWLRDISWIWLWLTGQVLLMMELTNQPPVLCLLKLWLQKGILPKWSEATANGVLKRISRTWLLEGGAQGKMWHPRESNERLYPSIPTIQLNKKRKINLQILSSGNIGTNPLSRPPLEWQKQLERFCGLISSSYFTTGKVQSEKSVQLFGE